jgi:hypothetical protein
MARWQEDQENRGNKRGLVGLGGSCLPREPVAPQRLPGASAPDLLTPGVDNP